MKMILTHLEVTMSLSGYKNIDEFRGKANAVLAKVGWWAVYRSYKMCTKSSQTSRFYPCV